MGLLRESLLKNKNESAKILRLRKRQQKLAEQKDLLLELNRFIPWESFRQVKSVKRKNKHYQG
jgi:ribulose kinase